MVDRSGRPADTLHYLHRGITLQTKAAVTKMLLEARRDGPGTSTRGCRNAASTAPVAAMPRSGRSALAAGGAAVI